MKPFTIVASVLLPVCLSMFAIACSVSAADSSSSDEDLSGSVDRERKCAAANAYDDADISDLTTLDDQNVPAPVRAAAGDATVSSFEVSGVGTVYASASASASGSQTKLFDRNGRLLVTGLEGFGAMRWLNGNLPLSCGNSPSSKDGGFEGGHSSSGGSDGGFTSHSDGGFHSGTDAGFTSSSGGSHSDGGFHSTADASAHP